MQQARAHSLSCSIDIEHFLGISSLAPDLDAISEISSDIAIVELLDELSRQFHGLGNSLHKTSSPLGVVGSVVDPAGQSQPVVDDCTQISVFLDIFDSSDYSCLGIFVQH